jgi:hypothetical protein
MTYTAKTYDPNLNIKVVWEDTLDNYSDDNKKEIEKYFKQKYSTEKVKVEFSPIKQITNGDTSDIVLADASDVVLDDAYQMSLMEKYLEINNIDIDINLLARLDKKVAGELSDYKDNTIRYKTFDINFIEFSNFLAYGDKNRIDVSKYDGLVNIRSAPANFGGKCLQYDTEIDISYDIDFIKDKLGFIPDELL